MRVDDAQWIASKRLMSNNMNLFLVAETEEIGLREVPCRIYCLAMISIDEPMLIDLRMNLDLVDCRPDLCDL
jgi:hypothetical protein